MKNLSLLLCFAICLASCNNNSPKTETAVTDTTPVTTQQVDTTVDLTAVEIKAEPLRTNGLPKYLSRAGKGGTESFEKFDVLTTSNPKCDGMPTKLSDLTSGAEYHIYRCDNSMSVTLSLLGFTGEIGKTELVFVEDYISYKIVKCDTGSLRVGVGLRCFIHVKTAKKKLAGQITKLTQIAASVEINNATAEYSLKALGFSFGADIIANGTTTAGVYDVENFAKLYTLNHEVMKLLKSDGKLKISPVVLP